MTDPVNQIKSAVTTEADSLKGVAQQFERKQLGWAETHLVPLIVGFILGALLGWVAHAIV